MRRAFKYRLHPTKAQITKLKHILELCRFVYNQTLALRKDAWKEKQERISYFESKRMLPVWKREKPELSNVHSQVLQNVTERVDLAFKNFFRRVKKGHKPGFPRFKGYGRYDSFTFTQGGFKLRDSNTLRVSKVGDIRINLHRPIEGTVKTLTIYQDKLGRWYACFSCVVGPKPLPVSQEVVGIDLGLTTFAVLSNGEKIERIRWAQKDEKDIARIHRKLSRAKKGSGERKEIARALNHTYGRSKSRRSNFTHQESRKLINKFGLIVFEQLDITGMQVGNNKNINKGISDVAWRQFVERTSSKAEEAGRGVLLIDPAGTSQQCSGCGSVVKKKLSTRVHKCPRCKLKLDRDVNAACNILARGLASLRHKPVEAAGL